MSGESLVQGKVYPLTQSNFPEQRDPGSSCTDPSFVFCCLLESAKPNSGVRDTVVLWCFGLKPIRSGFMEFFGIYVRHAS